MVNYASAFSLSELGKYFEWIVNSNNNYCLLQCCLLVIKIFFCHLSFNNKHYNYIKLYSYWFVDVVHSLIQLWIIKIFSWTQRCGRNKAKETAFRDQKLFHLELLSYSTWLWSQEQFILIIRNGSICIHFAKSETLYLFSPHNSNIYKMHTSPHNFITNSMCFHHLLLQTDDKVSNRIF